MLKLFNNILEWNDIVSAELLKELTLDCLLNRYIIVALQYMDLNIGTVDKIEYVSVVFDSFVWKIYFLKIYHNSGDINSKVCQKIAVQMVWKLGK